MQLQPVSCCKLTGTVYWHWSMRPRWRKGEDHHDLCRGLLEWQFEPVCLSPAGLLLYPLQLLTSNVPLSCHSRDISYCLTTGHRRQMDWQQAASILSALPGTPVLQVGRKHQHHSSDQSVPAPQGRMKRRQTTLMTCPKSMLTCQK